MVILLHFIISRYHKLHNPTLTLDKIFPKLKKNQSENRHHFVHIKQSNKAPKFIIGLDFNTWKISTG